VDNETFDTRLIMFMETTEEELAAAVENHGQFNSAHEGYGVLMEEVRELEAEIFKKRAERCGLRMYEECVQVAAMAAKLAIQIAEDMPVKEEEVSRG
jgi:hypothetical protein